MGKHVAEMTIKKLIQADKAVKGARVLILGLTFKEDVPDIRNTKVVDIINELREYGVEVQVHDPIADPEESWREYGVELTPLDNIGHFDAVVLAVAHQVFKSLDSAKIKKLACNGNGCGVVIDVKSMLDRFDIEGQGMVYWGL
jgi:UDP-N-acetyl-D-galactosamine dehydrogenase